MQKRSEYQGYGSPEPKEHLRRFLEMVLSGSKSNYALHKVLKEGNLKGSPRSKTATLCYSTLRYWRLISEDTDAGNGQEMAEKAPDWLKLNEQQRPGDLPYERLRSSLPEHLLKALESTLEREHLEEVLRDSLSEPIYIGCRANTHVGDRDALLEGLTSKGIEAAPSGLDKDAFLLPEGTSVDALPEYRSGALEVQDLSSQIVCRLALAGVQAGRVVDACAGNGGKTLALSAMMSNKGALISMDVNERSLLRLRQRARRARVWNYQRVLVKGEESLAPYKEWADLVLVDAPCSGLGTLRRNPDIRLHLSERDMQAFPKTQLEIMTKYSEIVRSGGRLVYCTCTLNRAENELVVQEFLDKDGGFTLLDAGELHGDLHSGLFRGHFFNPLPSDDRSGFFMAAMRKDR